MAYVSMTNNNDVPSATSRKEMPMFLRSAIAVLVWVVCAVGSVTAAPPDKSSEPFEFRLAEAAPAKGLVEATVARTGRKIYLPKKAVATNKDISAARLTRDANGTIAVEIEFTQGGSKKIARASKKHRRKPLAILLDGKVVAAPIIRGTISKKAVVLGMTRKQAARIVAVINGK